MNIRELWKRGIILSEAWYQFSSEELYRKYNRPKLSKSINPTSSLGILAESFKSDPASSKFIVRTQHVMEFNAHRLRVRKEMETDVIRQLQCKTLAAFGYLSGRNIKAAPLEIPERFFEAEYINWDANRISAPPHEFTFVRVLNVADNSAGRIFRPGGLAKQGRPSIRADVIMAMQSLANEEPDLSFTPRKEWTIPIRDRIHKLNPGKWKITQPNDRTIMRIIPEGERAITKEKKSGT